MKQIRWEILFLWFCSDIKIRLFKPANCGRAHYHCNPRAQPEKCRTANLVNFHPQIASKVNLTTWTNIITLFMNTVKHFVKNINAEIWHNPKESCEADKLLYTVLSFCLQLWFHGVDEMSVLIGWIDWTHIIHFWQIDQSHSYLWYCMCGGVDFMNGCVNTFIRT